MTDVNLTDASVKFIARRVAAPIIPEKYKERNLFSIPSNHGFSPGPDDIGTTGPVVQGQTEYRDYQQTSDFETKARGHPAASTRYKGLADSTGPADRKNARGHATHEKTASSPLRPVAGHVDKTTRQRAKNTRGMATTAIKRAFSTSKRQGSFAQTSGFESKPLGEPGGNQQMQPFRVPEDMSEASDDRSDHSIALSDSSLSPDAMEANRDLDSGEVEVLLQPQTRPITLDQLMLEVRTIYDGVVMFEDKAIRIDEEQTKLAQVDPKSRKPMSAEDYQSYIALHKALLHEHHDLCLATQHPAASPSLRLLPAKYSTPARMWRHGVHAPLEILRMRLPESREHMIAFVLISFNHMTLFLETVPNFEATWLECIGDLGRYRLALAETEEEREIFTGIARDWYHRAIQINPQIARLYHHCAILAPPFSIEQLSLYGRSLTGLIPFLPARKSILALFRPVLSNDDQLNKQLSSSALIFLRAHAALAIGGRGSRAKYNECLSQLQGGVLENLLADAGDQRQDRRRLACHIAVSCSVPMFQYGITRGNGATVSILRLAFGVSTLSPMIADSAMDSGVNRFSAQSSVSTLTAAEWATSRITVKAACSLAFTVLAEALQKPKDEDLLPLVHVFFVLIWGCSRVSKAMEEIENHVPWNNVAGFLNTYANAASMSAETYSNSFPVHAGGCCHTLPEDYTLQGLVFARGYLPRKWTDNSTLDIAEQAMEKEFMTSARIQRVLWAGHKIALNQKWLFYDEGSRKFNAGFGMEGLQLGGDERDFVNSVSDMVPVK